jgi:hypothetical protein
MDDLFHDPTKVAGFASIHKLKTASKQPYNRVREYLQSEDIYTQTKPAGRNFARRKIIARYAGEIVQIDLMDISKLSRANRGYKWILVGTDTLSKRLYLIPLKSKKSGDVCEALKIIVKGEPRLRLLMADQGSEFWNRAVTREILEPNNIKLYHTHSGIKASQSERMIRFVRERLERWALYTGNNNWIDVIGSIEKTYNNTKQSRTHIAPNAITRFNEMSIVEKLYPPVALTKPKYMIGQLVRILRSISVFAKKTKAQFTKEIFEIHKIDPGSPNTYHIKDLENKPILGMLYAEELSPVRLKSLAVQVRVVSYRNRRHRRYVQFSISGQTKPKWELLSRFNSKIRDGDYIKM